MNGYRQWLCPVMLGILITFSACSVAEGWHLTNEFIDPNPFEEVNRPASGAYLVVGGGRSFNNAALAYEAGIDITHMIHFDIDPSVLKFVSYFRQSISDSESPADLYSRALRSGFVGWAEYLRRQLFKWLIRFRNIYTDRVLFDHLEFLVTRPSESFLLDVNDSSSINNLVEYLKNNNVCVAVIDISNMLDGYVDKSKMLDFFNRIKPFSHESALVLKTRFGNRKYSAGHSGTFIYELFSNGSEPVYSHGF